MSFKKSLKRISGKSKKRNGQVLLEYVALVSFAIIALIAVYFWVDVGKSTGGEGERGIFDQYFRTVTQCAGGVMITE